MKHYSDDDIRTMTRQRVDDELISTLLAENLRLRAGLRMVLSAEGQTLLAVRTVETVPTLAAVPQKMRPEYAAYYLAGAEAQRIHTLQTLRGEK